MKIIPKTARFLGIACTHRLEWVLRCEAISSADQLRKLLTPLYPPSDHCAFARVPNVGRVTIAEARALLTEHDAGHWSRQDTGVILT